ncbi:MAG: DUF3034 family protein [Planctomycetota bacterium]|jgi:hypothetical protein
MKHATALSVVMLCVAAPAWASGDWSPSPTTGTLLAWENVVAAAAAAQTVEAADKSATGPPLPLMCLEGYSGGVITPTAYLANAGPKIGRPTVAYTYVNFGSKDLHSVAVTETFLGRIEVGYAVNVLNLGSLPNDIRKHGLNQGRDHVCLHHFNARLLVLPENYADLPVPAVTVGVHFKYNDGIDVVNHELDGALDSIGYDRHSGTDYTVTATKSFPKLAFGRPVILSAGMRNSRAAQIGLLGFSDTCHTTVEANAIVLPLDNVVVAYEFRQKDSPYDKLDKLIGEEDNWHAWSVTWVVNKNITVTGVYGLLGNIANASADGSFAFQVKIEF